MGFIDGIAEFFEKRVRAWMIVIFGGLNGLMLCQCERKKRREKKHDKPFLSVLDIDKYSEKLSSFLYWFDDNFDIDDMKLDLDVSRFRIGYDATELSTCNNNIWYFGISSG